jgi:hypothetical protein
MTPGKPSRGSSSVGSSATRDSSCVSPLPSKLLCAVYYAGAELDCVSVALERHAGREGATAGLPRGIVLLISALAAAAFLAEGALLD